MLQSVKFSNVNLFVTSDTHFGHNKEFIYKKRGYNSIFEHDCGLIEKWNSTVSDKDTVIHLGDFFLNTHKKRAKEVIFNLNGKIILLWGNHNSCVKDFYKEALYQNSYSIYKEVYPLDWEQKIQFVGNVFNFHAKNRIFIASHFPYKIWDSMKNNSLHINGHSHSGDKERNEHSTINKTLDVGIDNFGCPVPIERIIQIMDAKQYLKLDDHH